MAELPPPFLWDADSHTHLLEQFVTIHDDCIVHDHQLLTFLPDETTGRVDRTKLIKYWQQEATAVRDGLKDVIVQMSDDKRQGVVAGLVVLYKPPSETGPFRGVVEKLMVSPLFRRRGVARRLNLKLEEVAIQNNRGLLTLDTTIGTAAEHIYPRLGYKEFGVLRGYGISPKDGTLVDERFFYKDLRTSSSADVHDETNH